MVIVLALVTFFTWAIADVLGTVASRKSGHLMVNFFFGVCSFLLVSLYIPFAGPLAYWSYVWVALGLGALHFIGMLAYFHGLEVGNASLVGAIVGSFAVVIIAVSFLVFGETLRPVQALGIALCVVGLLLASFKLRDLRQFFTKAHVIDPGIGFALVTFFAWGLYFGLIRIPVERIGWFWSLYPATFYFPLLLLFVGVRRRVSVLIHDWRTLMIIAAMAFLGRSGDFAYNAALLYGQTSIVGAIAGVSPSFLYS